MATRTLLKMKINPNLPLRVFRNPTLVLTRPVSTITKPEASLLFLNRAATFPALGMTHNLFARQMGTSRSRGNYRMNDDEDDDDFEEDADDVDHIDEDGDDDTLDLGEYDDLDDDEEEEDEPPRKKTYGKKK